MRKLGYALAAALLLGSTSYASAQGDIQIFGFFQGFASQSFTTTKQAQVSQIPTPPFVTVNENEVKTDVGNFTLQQANIFASKDLGSSFSAFLNLEFVNSYSSDKGWGKFNLQEAFVKYEGSDVFNVKAGMFLPAFNNLYEIYNRMPLLPYITRPFVYETSYNTLLPPEDYLPTRALLQVYGFLDAGSAKVDYAVYFGNPEDSYIAPKFSGALNVPGWSGVSLKSVGARVGVRSGTLKAGVSTTFDSDNRRDTAAANNFGDVPRQRIGADLSYSIAGFTLSGELIMVNNKLTDEQKKKIEPNKLLDGNMDKVFYYVTLQYDVNDQLFVYGMYNSIEDHFSPIVNPLTGISAGGGYRANDNVVIKLQYAQSNIDKQYPGDFSPSLLAGKSLFVYTSSSISAGVSVAF